MNDYWVGVLFGFFAGLVFFMVCLFVLSYRINSLQGEFNELKVEHDQLSEWVSDNETVMKTYEFFNEHIKELLEERKENDN
jgi:hypothetical protein